ncbi:chromosomal replication initiator protein DnaA [Humisphaera borealis]|uniref:Chromosomal replication initiator protein DnaA n=1 Tax=Humisphaera borealis TaxID=2807512 RepID=A0A7M2WYV0_9BACT|nr:chromosomal replication initiator protein DnaA [Humisphaera borealis]QOV90544.1 chromosomal replication initiator protein DnaA [Humisphaera borealis]
MSCVTVQDPQLVRLADAIAQRVGQQRFHVWFDNSTRLDLRQDGLEIAVPNDFISEWINKNFAAPIQEAAHEVLGTQLTLRFSVVPELFEVGDGDDGASSAGNGTPDAQMLQQASGVLKQGRRSFDVAAPIPVGQKTAGVARLRRDIAAVLPVNGQSRSAGGHPVPRPQPAASGNNGNGRNGTGAASTTGGPSPMPGSGPRLRHELTNYVVGVSNQLAFNAASHVAEFPGTQYNPLFIHGACGLGKTHLLQGLCRKFIECHPTKRWAYLTGEEFTNDYITSLRANKIDGFRRRMRDLDLLVIDDVHFLSGKTQTQVEFLHTFNAIEASGRQVVLASDEHPKMIAEFGESLINRFVSGMVVRVDPPNYQMRCDILRSLSLRSGVPLSEEVIGWVARRVTQNVRELEGSITRIMAHVNLTGCAADVATAQAALGDIDRQHAHPVKPENVLSSVCEYFGLEHKDLMSGRRQRTISLARSVAMFLVRKTAKLSFPEIGTRMGKRNHSTVISACRRIERAVERNERLAWTSSVGEREEEAMELVQRLEEHARAIG